MTEQDRIYVRPDDDGDEVMTEEDRLRQEDDRFPIGGEEDLRPPGVDDRLDDRGMRRRPLPMGNIDGERDTDSRRDISGRVGGIDWEAVDNGEPDTIRRERERGEHAAEEK